MAHETLKRWDLDMRQRLQRGEAAALGELYDRFAVIAYAIAQRVLDDEDATAEITREVFLRIWESPQDFDPEQGPMRSWIAAKAHRLAVGRLRRRGGDGPDEHREQQVRAAATAARADYIMTVMPSPLRHALEQARFQRQSCRQLAERLEISEDEARRRLRLGLQLLSSAADYPAGEEAR